MLGIISCGRTCRKRTNVYERPSATGSKTQSCDPKQIHDMLHWQELEELRGKTQVQEEDHGAVQFLLVVFIWLSYRRKQTCRFKLFELSGAGIHGAVWLGSGGCGSGLIIWTLNCVATAATQRGFKSANHMSNSRTPCAVRTTSKADGRLGKDDFAGLWFTGTCLKKVEQTSKENGSERDDLLQVFNGLSLTKQVCEA